MSLLQLYMRKILVNNLGRNCLNILHFFLIVGGTGRKTKLYIDSVQSGNQTQKIQHCKARVAKVFPKILFFE